MHVDNNKLGIGLGLVGVGCGLVVGLPPNSWPQMPVVYVNIGLGIGLVLTILGLVLVFGAFQRGSRSPQHQRGYEPLADQDAYPPARARPQPAALGKQGSVRQELSFGKLIAGALVFPAVSALLLTDFTKNAAKDFTTSSWDKYFCGGQVALEEGHRLSDAGRTELKDRKDLNGAQRLFRQANDQYRAAWACGIPDAGLRLAFAFCEGLGETRDLPRGRQYLNDVEKANRDRADIMRLSAEVRQRHCSAS